MTGAVHNNISYYLIACALIQVKHSYLLFLYGGVQLERE